MWWYLLRAIPILATAVMFMSQVGPSDAAANLGKWLEWFGLAVPSWLLAPRVDQIAFWGGAITLTTWTLWYLRDRLEPYATNGFHWAARQIGYIDGEWTWTFQRPWKRLKSSTSNGRPAAAADIWRERDRLEVYVIACRSVSIEPSLPVDRDPQNSRMRYLADAIVGGRLVTASGNINGTGPGDGHMTQVKYLDLRSFAEREGNADLIRFCNVWDWRRPSLAVTDSREFAAKVQSGEWRLSTAQPYLANQVAECILHADDLIEEGISDESAFEAWKVKYRTWLDKLRKTLSATDMLHFRDDLLRVPELLQTKYANAYNAEHNALLNGLQRARKELQWKHATYRD